MIQRGVKRQRTAVIMSPKRPIDKDLVVIKKDGVAASQVATVLKTATFPCTITGIRWDLDISQDAAAGSTTNLFWAIVIVRDGNSASTLATSDASSLYQPEQDVLAFGCALGAYTNGDVRTAENRGSTKTMRKMMAGDALHFIAIGQATQTHAIRGIVQFFCKT